MLMVFGGFVFLQFTEQLRISKTQPIGNFYHMILDDEAKFRRYIILKMFV